jgi:pimeloyl-ACP methyl ester carboxylesterase
LAGFSFGAMTAFGIATEQNPHELWLFSLSPYFAEDMPNIKKPWLKIIGKHRAEAFRRLSFNQHAKAIRCKTLVFVGELELKKYPLRSNRCQTAHKALPSSKLIIVPDCGHDVANSNYIKAIEKNI